MMRIVTPSHNPLLNKRGKIPPSTMLTYITAAALTTMSSSTVNAFQVSTSFLPTTRGASCLPLPSMFVVDSNYSGQNPSWTRTQGFGYQHSGSRLFFSRDNSRNSNDDEDKSFLGKVKNLVPSFLKPKKDTGRLTQREKAKDQVSSSIDTMLKDAPLGVRMMGKMIKPIISSAVGSLAEAVEEQSRQMSDLLDDARMYIVSDQVAISELGEPIEVGSPFSQSSSTMSVNGKTKSSINASFEVRGTRGSGIATIDATDGKISSLSLNVNGRRFNIDVTGGPKSTTVGGSAKRGSGLGKNRVFNDDDIIDAEFVEKKVEK